jgi:hypothetical protein
MVDPNVAGAALYSGESHLDNRHTRPAKCADISNRTFTRDAEIQVMLAGKVECIKFRRKQQQELLPDLHCGSRFSDHGGSTITDSAGGLGQRVVFADAARTALLPLNASCSLNRRCRALVIWSASGTGIYHGHGLSLALSIFEAMSRTSLISDIVRSSS